MTQTPHATMNTLMSFWSDIENVKRAPYQAMQNDILEYLKWVQEEKARADAAEKALGMMEGERDQYKMWQLDEEKRANDAEAREQRLKEVAEALLSLFSSDNKNMYVKANTYMQVAIPFEDKNKVNSIREFLSTLYPDTTAPKEGDNQ